MDNCWAQRMVVTQADLRDAWSAVKRADLMVQRTYLVRQMAHHWPLL